MAKGGSRVLWRKDNQVEHFRVYLMEKRISKGVLLLLIKEVGIIVKNYKKKGVVIKVRSFI
jgi:hypothetical protein